MGDASIFPDVSAGRASLARMRRGLTAYGCRKAVVNLSVGRRAIGRRRRSGRAPFRAATRIRDTS